METKKTIIDIHAHAYPDDLSEKAIASMEKVFGINSKHGGRVSDLLKAMDASGIDLSVLQGVAMKAEQVPSINSWLMSVQSPRIRCFAAMHPDFTGFREELSRVKGAGFWGVKFQPEFQGFFPDEERLFPFYEAIQDLNLAVLFHAGFELSNPGAIHATPQRLRRVCDRFPDLKIIAGHFGGFLVWEDVERFLVGTRVFFDTACVFGALEDSRIRDIILRHGPEKVLFGTDHPLYSSKDSLDGFRRLSLSESDSALVLGGNAMRLFNIN